MAKKKEPTNLTPAVQKALIKNINRTFNTKLLQLQVRKKLLLELGGELAIIMSNADELEICPFVMFIWEQHHHITLVVIVRLIH